VIGFCHVLIIIKRERVGRRQVKVLVIGMREEGDNSEEERINDER
jgi:hypothetical protein